MIIFDKDHTLIRPASGGVWVEDPTDQEPLIPVTTIAALAQEHDLYIASNQGGVAAGHKTLREAIREMEYCLDLFPSCSGALFCPDFDGDVCIRVQKSVNRRGFCSDKLDFFKGEYRKPNAGMIKEIIVSTEIEQGLTLDPLDILFVGDRPEDEQAAFAAKCEFLYVDQFLKKHKC